MAHKQTPQAAPDTPTAADALEQAAQALARSAAEMQQALAQMGGPGDGADGPAPSGATAPVRGSGDATLAGAPARSAKSIGPKEAARFYEGLEQAGQLMDVDEKTDLSKLPSRVTHVRHPDGSVQRIGFSASPYASE